MTTINPATERNRKFLLRILTASAHAQKDTASFQSIHGTEGETICLEKCNSFRLFFLMAGKVVLTGQQHGRQPLHGMEMVLLPPSEKMECAILENSEVVVLTCEGFNYPANSAYLDRLKKLADKSDTVYTSLPLHQKLATLLQNMLVYGGDELRYINLYDTFFIMLRSLYTEKELATFFYPVIGAERVG